jgi:signal transduction histidine kinase
MKNKNYREQLFYLITIFFLLLADYGLCAVIPKQGAPIIKNYPVNEIGVGGPQIWSAIQDKRGMMYFCDQMGIIEFNGKEWKRISNANNSVVRKMAMDSLGRIYVGASGDFGFLEPNATGEMKFVSIAQPIIDQGIKFLDIWKTICTNYGVYFFSNKYVFRYFEKKISVIPVNFSVQDAYLINQKLYLPTKGGLCMLKDTIQVPVTQKVCFQLLPWVGDRLLSIDGKSRLTTFSLSSFEIRLFDSPVQKLLKTDKPAEITRIDENLFAITTESDKIIVLNNNGDIIQLIDRQSGLMSGRIYGIYPDRDKNLWVTMSKGIAKVDINYPVNKFGENNNVQSTVLSTIVFEGIRYIGTHDGIYYLSPFDITRSDESSRFVKIKADAPECWELFEKEGKLFALSSLGLWAVSGTKARLIYKIELPQKAHCIGDSYLFPNTYFLGMRGKLIAIKLDKSLNVTEIIDFPEVTEKIRKIVCNKEGNLWLSTQYNGVYFIRFMNGNIKDYHVTLLGKNNKLPQLEYTRSFIVGDNVVVATDSGIVAPIFPKKELPDSLIRFEYTKVFGDTIRKPVGEIAHFASDKYIISGNGMHFATIGGTKSSYDTCGFYRLSCIIEHLSVSSDSIISLCSSDGLFCYDAKLKRNFRKPFNTMVSKVVLNNDSTLFDGNFLKITGSEQIASLVQIEKMIPKIDYKFNSISFYYSALFYEDPDVTEFKHQLIGFDKKWNEWSTDDKTSYTNLPPGKYTFVVKAMNCHEVVSDIAEYKFIILPPWYLAWWAYTFYVFLLIGFIWLVVKLYTRRLQSQKEYLELVVEERTDEIIEQARELKVANDKLIEMDKFKQGVTNMIVHDLKNPINAIINSSDTDAVNQLKKLRQTGKQMLTLVMNILDVSKYEETKFPLTIENHQLLNVCKKAIEQITFLSLEKNITIFNSISSEIGIRADAEIVERIFVNIFTNAIKYTPNNGWIKIDAEQNTFHIDHDSYVKITITDNGIGIAEDKIHLVFEKFGQVAARNSGSVRSTGLGLTFCKMAVEAHGGVIGIDSEIGKGSTLWFTLPYYDANSGIVTFKPQPIESKQISLSASIRDLIEIQLTELRNIEFYKISEIIEILNGIKDDGMLEIKTWKQEVMNAIESGNEILYKKLLQ